MQFNSFTIHLESDGFRIQNPKDNVPRGTPLVAYYELPDGWETVELEFEPTGWSILHPFTRSGMFIYTGQEPIRVLIKLASNAHWPQRSPESPISATHLQQRPVGNRNLGVPVGMLCCYPAFSDDIWSDGSLQSVGNPDAAPSQSTVSDDAPQQVEDEEEIQPQPTHFGGVEALEADVDSSILLEDPDPAPSSFSASDSSIVLEDPDPTPSSFSSDSSLPENSDSSDPNAY